MSGDLIIWTPGVTLAEIERQVIEKSFAFYKGNKSATARALGVTVKTLDNKFERYASDDAAANEAKAYDERRRQELLERSRYGTGAGISNPLVPSTAPSRRDVPPHVERGVEPASDVSAPEPLPMSDGQEFSGVLPSDAPPRRRGRPRSAY